MKEEESLKVTKVIKKNLFNENSCHGRFSKRKCSVGYGTKVSKMFFLSTIYTTNSTNIDRAKKSKRRVHNKQTKKFKSINNQSTINQSKYKSFTPAWYLAKILNKRHGKTKENTRKVNKMAE